MLEKERKKGLKQLETPSFLEMEGFRIERELKKLVQVNLQLKTELSKKIKTDFVFSKLNDLEIFNNRLIIHDELILMLSREWSELNELIKKNLSNDGFIENILQNKLRVLSSKLEETRSLISSTRKEFKD